ncbi:MAG TPA: aspartyl-phosphate phosphatase Spo0E family protein [Firmicutes bacterium]|nr:aspartyl-phosphate phosphatase Spo0E family protein [Bacillota bacterium]
MVRPDSDENLAGLRDEIEKLRLVLNSLVPKEGKFVISDEMRDVSRELDRLISKYIHLWNRSTDVKM